MQERMMNKEDLEKRDFLLQFWDHLGDVDKDIRDASTLSHVDAKKGTCTVVFTVGQKHVNGFGKLHGGVICTIVDIIGTFALLACQPPDKYVPGVSTDINVSFFHGTDLGSQVLVEAKVLKNGMFCPCQTQNHSIIYNNLSILMD